jgi:predicted dehydrogenase
MKSNPIPRVSQSRREFLKRSAVAASAAVPALSIARAAHAAGSDVIRIGMIGCGGRCTGAAADAMTADPATRLVAMTDPFLDRVKAKREVLRKIMPEQVQVDDDRCFGGLDGYRKVIESVDYVLIACAAKFHPMYAKAAVEAGKHVFVEKPHGIDPYGVKVMREAAEIAKKKNLGFLSGLQSRFTAPMRETIQRVHDGQIGQIISIEENYLRGPYGRTERPKDLRELEIQFGNQYRFAWLSGDDVPQSLVHNLDRVTWALKETPPERCHGLGGRSGLQNLLGDVFDHHSVTYQYASGVRVYAFCRTTLDCFNEVTSSYFGTKGVAYPMAGRITGEKPWKFTGQQEPATMVEHRELLKSVRAGKPLNCGDYMTRSTLVGIMGQMSCYSGKEITWEQVSKSDYFIPPKPDACTWDMEAPTKADANGVYPVCFMPGVSRNV